MELAHEDYSFGDLSDKGGERAKFLFDQYLRYRNFQFDAKSPSKKNDEEKYGDYITYQVIDSASLFVPVERMLISTRESVWKEIFTFSGDILEEILVPNLEDIASYKKANESLEEQSQAPRKPNTNMTRWDHTAGESHLQNISSVLKSAETLRSLGKTWVDEIFPHWKKSCLQKHDISLLLLTPLLFSSHEFISSCSNSQFKSTCLDPISQCFPECSKSDRLCNRAVFIRVSKSNWFCTFYTMRLAQRFAPPFHPIRSKTKANCDALACIFPRFASATCNYFEF